RLNARLISSLPPNRMDGSNTPHLSWRLWQEVRPYWPHLVMVFLLGLLSAPLALLAPLPLKIAVDSVIGSHPLPAFLAAWLPQSLTQSPNAILLLAVLLLVGVTVAAESRDLVSQWLAAYTGEKLLSSVRAKLFRHVQRLSLSYHDSKGTANSVYRIQYYATSFQRIAVDCVVLYLL